MAADEEKEEEDDEEVERAAEGEPGEEEEADEDGEEAPIGGPVKGKPTPPNPRKKGEEMLKECLQSKEIGMGAYKVQDWKKAIDCWSMARGSAKYIREQDFFKGDEEKRQYVCDLENTMHLNLAMVHLKNEEFYQALDFAGRVLAKEPNNTKALYRKASAHVMGSQYPEARDTLKKLLEVEPDNAAARQMLNEIVVKSKEAKKKGAKIAKTMLGGMEHDPRSIEQPEEEEGELSAWFLLRWMWDLGFCSWCKRRRSDESDDMMKDLKFD
eukprot:gnl/TRDRNA2_/TRDRNA2_185907_c0_seq1.p1 gnl/TRDRNA2_/TRDRNA2_185907_c0~~gnl/TRDRNA2_/TRDRNA2_185907_c0_seq1.p1  ORF type:complete len:301 (-),score=79.85 gnl/TRDRNA2_/TRDRNA2_185907_c0_seq1:85-891(-)